MAKTLHITVVDKVATYCQRDGIVVCGNSDYEIEFTFDAEWDDHTTKTARFISNGGYEDVVFQGDTVAVPIQQRTTTLAVGVFSGNLKTTTPAIIPCQKSILCEDGVPADPAPDVYAQIIELLNSGGGGGDCSCDMQTLEEMLQGFDSDPGSVKQYVDDAVAGVSSASHDVEPAEDDIPKVFFGAALPQTKTDTVMSFRYISKTADISGYCKTKAQGNSSMDYPKKNQTVKLYADEACSEKLKVDFKGWGEQSKFVFKANWIDLSHARNIVSARLWGDVVRSRSDYDTLPELLRTSPNHGAVDGFPVKVYAAGVYQGRYSLNIPKDAWMANMDDELDTHCILCSENYESGCFRAAAAIDESDWSDEIHDSVPASIVTRWNEVITFVMTSTDEDFKANLGNYIDVQSLLDYEVFGLAICDLDGFGKNQLFLTYDGAKWYASAYDKDSTFGLYWNGSEFVSTTYGRDEYEDYVGTREGNLLFERIEKLFYAELQARWAELKEGALSVTNIINRFERYTDIAPLDLVQEDYASTTANGAYMSIPSQDTNNIQQIRAYALARHNWTDGYIGILNGEEPPAEDDTTRGDMYSLSEATVFDGATHIDTGVKLFDTAKDFTIVMYGTFNQADTTNTMPFHCVDESGSPYYGLGLNYYIGSSAQTYQVKGGTGTNGTYLMAIPKTNTKWVFKVEQGVLTEVRYGSTTKTIDPLTYQAHDQTLVLGGYKTATGTYGRHWKGVISRFDVFSHIMSDDEITAYFAEATAT